MKPFGRSPVALAVLAMLCEAPMHPYRMQHLIKARGKDEFINVTQRASLYQTIRRLQREGLIAAQETVRDARRPQRTVYRITEQGRAMTLQWMRQMLATPLREYPEFPAAVSFLALLTPEDALQQFERRAKAIQAELLRIAALLDLAAAVPRLFLLEGEFMRAQHATELAWVQGVIADLRAGRLTWNEAWLRQVAAQFATEPPDLKE